MGIQTSVKPSNIYVWRAVRARAPQNGLLPPFLTELQKLCSAFRPWKYHKQLHPSKNLAGSFRMTLLVNLRSAIISGKVISLGITIRAAEVLTRER